MLEWGAMSEHVTIETTAGVAVITMDDGRANALGPDLIAAVSAAITDAAGDESVGSIVLAGRPGRFSAGFDLGVMQTGDRAAVEAMVDGGGSLVRQLYGLDLPVVAACTGHAVAAGALLLLGCDVRVGPAAPVKIGLNEVAIGLPLPGWALAIAMERLSRRHLQRSVANARLFDGQGAVDAGFLDVAVDPDSVVERAVDEATMLSALDRPAYRAVIGELRGSVLAAMDAALPGTH